MAGTVTVPPSPEVSKIPNKEELAARFAPKKAEPAKVEPPKEAAKGASKPAEPAKAQEFPLETFNKTYNTEFKSPDELKAILENNKKYGETTQKYEEIAKKYRDLEEKSKVNPFADDFAKTINEMRRNGDSPEKIKAFVEINAVDFEKMSNEDKMIWSYRLKNGLTEKEARIALEDEYSIREEDYELSEDLDGEDLKKAKEKIARQIEKETIRLKRDANGVVDSLLEYKKKVSTVEKPEDAFNKKWSEYEPNVKEIAPVIAENYKGLKGIPLSAGKEGDVLTFDFEVPDEFKKAIPSLVNDYLLGEFAQGRPVNLNADGLKQVYRHLDLTLKGYAFDKFILDSNIHTASKVREEMANKFSNGGKKHTGDIPKVEGEPLSNIDRYKQAKLGKAQYFPTLKKETA